MLVWLIPWTPAVATPAATLPVDAVQPALPVHPELLALAAQAPQMTAPVIVQMLGDGAAVEEEITRLGGVVTQRLGIIHSLAAELPAGAVADLGRVPGVRWISLDAPVESHTSPAHIRYYLQGNPPGVDAVAQATLPMTETVPTAPRLANYDQDRDSAPGLLIRRGGTVDSDAASGQAQRWRLGPFNTDMRLSGSSFVQLYAAMKDFAPGKRGKLWAYVYQVDVNGQRQELIATGSLSRTWRSSWQTAKIKFDNVDILVDEGHSLELVVTVDITSEDDMWLAFGTRSQPAAYRVNLQDALLSAKNFYLVNYPVNAEGDTTSHPILPVRARKPKIFTLPNFDTDRDGGPGIVVKRGGTITSSDASGKIQRWRISPFQADTQIGPNVEFELYAATKSFRKTKFAKLWAYLIHRDAEGRLIHVLGSGSVEADDWGETWQQKTIAFKNSTYAFPAGHQLEVALTVDDTSERSMWIAYGSGLYPAQLKGEFWALLPQVFLDTIGARTVWDKGYEGRGVRVAVIDSGIQPDMPDFARESGEGPDSRIIHSEGIGTSPNDEFGHGTFVAGVIGSNGSASGGYYKGVAPEVDLINVRVSDAWGGAYESTVVAAIQWVLEHKDEYNIRVVNLSLNSSTLQPYHQSPLDAAVEVLWFNGIVVVASAGNNGSAEPGVIYPPANDPFVIAVGSTDDMETATPNDDVLAADYSVFGLTAEGFFRPDLAAPGSYIISTLADASNFKNMFPYYHRGVMNSSGNLVKLNFQASGTSISSGMVTGAAALLLQARPDLNPDQVKYLLMTSATPIADEAGAGAGSLNVAKALEIALAYGNNPIPTANTGRPVSQLLTTGSEPIQWNSVNWNSVNWNSVNWNSVNWNSVNWNSIAQSGTAAANTPAAGNIPVGIGHTLRPPMALENDELPSEDLPNVPEPEQPGEPEQPEEPKEPEEPGPDPDPDPDPETPAKAIYLPLLRR
ncbi:MAG: S8 family peptidase [Caldilineaceae bacterium]|nr:S8 family peptidase [Caldilineaceae bacterium]